MTRKSRVCIGLTDSKHFYVGKQIRLTIEEVDHVAIDEEQAKGWRIGMRDMPEVPYKTVQTLKGCITACVIDSDDDTIVHVHFEHEVPLSAGTV
jgi:hypothetical protein